MRQDLYVILGRSGVRRALMVGAIPARSKPSAMEWLELADRIAKERRERLTLWIGGGTLLVAVAVAISTCSMPPMDRTTSLNPSQAEQVSRPARTAMNFG